jgi:hypothetical protein
MAETIGSLVDKLSICQLKVFHMREQTQRDDATEEHRSSCRAKLAILEQQRADLGAELEELLVAVLSGRKRLKVYRQFKMYNDPKYRSGTREEP